MRFEASHRLPAPPETVLAMYRDPDYARRRFILAGHEAVEVTDQQLTAEHLRTASRYRMRPDIELPGLARRFVPQGMPVTVESVEEWVIATRRGRLDIRILPLPQTRITADLHLDADGDDSIIRIAWHIDCRIPLIGGRLAALLGEDIRIKSRKDHEASCEIINDYR